MLRSEQIVQAWKDKTYFESLSEAEQMVIPPCPAGLVELSDESLVFVVGANRLTLINTDECGTLASDTQ